MRVDQIREHQKGFKYDLIQIRSLTSAQVEYRSHIWAISLQRVVDLVHQLENLIEIQNQVGLVHPHVKQFLIFTFLRPLFAFFLVVIVSEQWVFVL